ncbi:MAG: DNA translocase FtsK [Candidatus Omnitrophica bacterium]|nr:DNA translocase FtsK [Candidatus Omnitrophota bacterium]
MRTEHLNEIKGIIILALALILLASLGSFVPDDLIWYTSHPNEPAHNLIRMTGAYTAGTLFFLVGHSAYLIIVFLMFWSWNIFTSRETAFSVARGLSLIVLMSVMSGLFSLTGSPVTANRFQRGGLTGLLFSDFLFKNIGPIGAYIILFALACLCLVVTADFLVSPLIVRATRALISAFEKARAGLPVFEWPKFGVKKDQPAGDEVEAKPKLKVKPKVEKPVEEKQPEKIPVKPVKPVEPPKPQVPNIRIVQPKVEQPKEREDKPLVVGDYQLPPFDLLNDPPKSTESNVQELLVSGAKTLEQTLASFDVVCRVADIERGPVITRYELEPAPGVRVQSINALADDIALAMQAASVRIQAPIPGKNRVGIEVPNGLSAAVVLKDVLINGDIRNSKSKITLALGKDTAGKAIIADLSDMPHLLVAGSTGAGKSVCLNVIIMSILYNASPNEVKFIMIDPKMVELNQYNDIPHMLCPAITDHKKVASALGWVITEMETRYKTLQKHQVKNIKAYHAKGFEMPYIVVVVDEFADLMQTSGKVIESAITRLAQLARAVGIHLILATQRPSVNVITGTIKANLPARIAFKVASQIDSRTILDEKGAEDLLGKGDMLFIRPGDPKPLRGQCSYLSDEEIHRVMDFIRNQAKPKYDDSVTTRPVATAGNNDEKDEIFDEALKVVMESGQASASQLQRRLSLGFSRAGRIIDQMERAGFIGPNVGSKPREILIDREKWIEENNKKGTDGGKPSEGTA